MGNTGLYEEYAGVIYAIREQRGNIQLYRDYIGNRAIRLMTGTLGSWGFLGLKRDIILTVQNQLANTMEHEMEAY